MMGYKDHGRNVDGRPKAVKNSLTSDLYFFTLFLQGASVGVELKRFAWL